MFSRTGHCVIGVFIAITAGGVALASDEELRDPTRPTGWQVVPQPEAADATDGRALKLQATFNVGGARSAMVNGQRVRVGDLVGGAEVVDIHADKVILVMDGERRELMAGVLSVKHPATDRAGGR